MISDHQFQRINSIMNIVTGCHRQRCRIGQDPGNRLRSQPCTEQVLGKELWQSGITASWMPKARSARPVFAHMWKSQINKRFQLYSHLARFGRGSKVCLKKIHLWQPTKEIQTWKARRVYSILFSLPSVLQTTVRGGDCPKAREAEMDPQPSALFTALGQAQAACVPAPPCSDTADLK